LVCFVYTAESPMNKLPSAATVNWAVFISTGTEIAFQIPHNLFPSLLHAHKGGILEYPFAAYALADSRWAEYNGGTGLLREVCVLARPGSGCAPSRCRCSSDINWNDGALGLALAAAYLYRSSPTHPSLNLRTPNHESVATATALLLSRASTAPEILYITYVSIYMLAV
jgi:hypothetical protein